MKTFEIAARLLSDFKKEECITNKELIEELKNKGIDLNYRILYYYNQEHLIERPTRIGRIRYHRKDYVFDALACIFILKHKYSLTAKKTRVLMDPYRNSIKVLLGKLALLDKDMDYLQLKEKLC